MKKLLIQGGIWSNELPTGNLLWVDAVNGNDSLAVRGRLSVPFKTLTAAKNAALSGDTIMVLPGTYSDQGLAKNGVNWHFLNGAHVSGSTAAPVFQVTSIISFKVTGNGTFESATYILEITGSAAAGLFFQCKSMINTLTTCVRVTNGNPLMIEADEIISEDSPAIETTGGTLHVTARRINCDLSYAISFGGGTVNVDAYAIISSSLPAVKVSGAGSLIVCAHEINTDSENTIEYDNSSNTGWVLVRGARIVSAQRCVHFQSGGNPAGAAVVRLDGCVLIAGSGAQSIGSQSDAAAKVLIYGVFLANAAKGPGITLIGAGVNQVDSAFI